MYKSEALCKESLIIIYNSNGHTINYTSSCMLLQRTVAVSSEKVVSIEFFTSKFWLHKQYRKQSLKQCDGE